MVVIKEISNMLDNISYTAVTYGNIGLLSKACRYMCVYSYYFDKYYLGDE